MKNVKPAARQMRSPQNNHFPIHSSQMLNPRLRFTPYAWAKLVYLRDVGNTEIGGFGIATASDPLLIQEIALVRQYCDWATVNFDDEAVADFFETQVDTGRQPSEFARLWIHTHPGNCPLPSATDEATYERVFGGSDWAVMFILARDGSTYARLRFNVGPNGALVIPVEIDYDNDFPASDQLLWLDEYQAKVQQELSTSQWPAMTQHSIFTEEVDPGEDEDDRDFYTERWMLTPQGEEVSRDLFC